MGIMGAKYDQLEKNQQDTKFQQAFLVNTIDEFNIAKLREMVISLNGEVIRIKSSFNDERNKFQSKIIQQENSKIESKSKNQQKSHFEQK